MEPKQKVILVADDDRDDQELLEDALLDVDPHVRADKVSDGREALAYLEGCGPHSLPCVILLDYSMDAGDRGRGFGHYLQRSQV